MRNILLGIIFLVSIGLSFGQDQIPPDLDRIVFKNHSQLEGKILEISKRWVVIKVGNAPFTINKNKVASIYYQGEVISFLHIGKGKINKDQVEPGLEEITAYNLVPVKETAKRGFYNITYGAIHFKDSSFGFESLVNNGGNGVENITGFQISQFSGFGLGIGYHATSNPRDGALVPVYAEYRGYFNNWKVSPYYAIAFGATFGSRKEDTRYDSSKAGSYFYPCIGFKSGSDQSAFMIDLGVRFANLTTFRSTEPTKENYKEVALRIGIMF